MVLNVCILSFGKYLICYLCVCMYLMCFAYCYVQIHTFSYLCLGVLAILDLILYMCSCVFYACLCVVNRFDLLTGANEMTCCVYFCMFVCSVFVFTCFTYNVCLMCFACLLHDFMHFHVFLRVLMKLASCSQEAGGTAEPRVGGVKSNSLCYLDGPSPDLNASRAGGIVF